MTKLEDLYSEHGQSAWLDNLRRDWIEDGTLQHWVDRGVRGVTSNPTILAKAMTGGTAYDDQFETLSKERLEVLDIYWRMAIDDISHTLALFRPLYDSSGGGDGFVSLEVGPDLARDTEGTITAAREFHTGIDEPNLLVKIPATAEGIPAIRTMLSEGRSINITLIFSLERYGEVIEAYLAGLEAYAASLPTTGDRADADLSTVHSVASFFVSRVDTEVDKRLEKLGTDEAMGLRGRAAVAQAKLAYRLFSERFTGPRWEALVARGAKVQRPLWASTSTKNPAYPSTLYVDTLIGPDTVNTMPDATLEGFEQEGMVARTVDEGVEEAQLLFDRLAEVGVEMEDVGRVLEEEGVESFAKSFDDLIASLTEKAQALAQK